MNYQKIHERLGRSEAILLDGVVELEVLRRGVYWRCHGIDRKPDVVREIHADYIRAVASGFDSVRRSSAAAAAPRPCPAKP